MKTPELETVRIFSRDIFLNLTINQISKELNKSYAFTNRYVRDFLSEGILAKKVVGSAILCSLNFSNEKTLGLLMLNSIEEKARFTQKADKKVLGLLQQLKKAHGLRSLFISGDKISMICEKKQETESFLDEFMKKSGSKNSADIILMDENEFRLAFRSIDFKNTVIMEGYEKFWKLIAKMVS